MFKYILMRYAEAPHPLLYGALHPIVYGVLKQKANLIVEGRKKIPKKGGVVLSGAHRDEIDGPTYAAVARRALHIMVKMELWTPEYDFEKTILQTPLGDLRFKANAGEIAESFGGFPVDRENPQPSTFRHATKLIKEGKVVAIFAEGSRYEDRENKIPRGQEIGPLFDSVGRLSAKHYVPVVAAGVKVIRSAKKSGWLDIEKMAVVFEEPFLPPDNVSYPDAVGLVMDEAHKAMQSAQDRATEIVTD